jgi:putative Mg2+ transporter-C (MgtC) family protein
MEYELIMSLRLLLSALLGGLIGLERESLNKSAGFRTHTLVSLGSCLITISSIEFFNIYGHGTIGDPARLAAQVVSGIGFLGAGTIVRSGFGIKGLTTAATLWVVAAIGIAVGIGSYISAIVTTGIVFFVLVYMTSLENFVKSSPKNLKRLDIIVRDKPGQIGRVSTAMGELEVHIRNVQMGEPLKNNRIKLTFTVSLPYTLKTFELVEALKKVEDVYEITVI